jgi:hypothetical protein
MPKFVGIDSLGILRDKRFAASNFPNTWTVCSWNYSLRTDYGLKFITETIDYPFAHCDVKRIVTGEYREHDYTEILFSAKMRAGFLQ